MVSLEAIRESNARITSELPAGVVAVFFGATSGIGETTLNPNGEYHYLKCDASLVPSMPGAPASKKGLVNPLPLLMPALSSSPVPM